MSKRLSICSFSSLSDSISESLADIDTDNLEPDAQVPIRIPIFREGKFKHPVYGKVKIDLAYLQSLIRNHEKGVLARDVSFDEDHKRYHGEAIGWLASGRAGLSLEQVDIPLPTGDGATARRYVLFADLLLNRRGARAVKERRYRYFSAEVSNRYSTLEMIPVDELGISNRENTFMQDDGTAIIQHGPTLIGGALTNSPFIPGLGAVAFSADGAEISECDFVRDLARDEIQDGYVLYFVDTEETPSDEVEEEQFTVASEQAMEDTSIHSNDSNDEEQEFATPESQVKERNGEHEMEKLIQELRKFTAPADRVTFLEGVVGSDTYSHAESLFAAELLRIEQENEQAFRQVTSDALRAQEEVKELQERNASLRMEAARAHEIAYTDRVKVFSKEQAENGHYPSVIKACEDFLLSSPVETRDQLFRFSTDAEPIPLMGMLARVLDSLPEDARMDFSTNLAVSTNEVEVEVKPEIGSTERATVADDESVIPDKVIKFTRNTGASVLPSQWDLIDDNGELIRE